MHFGVNHAYTMLRDTFARPIDEGLGALNIAQHARVLLEATTPGLIAVINHDLSAQSHSHSHTFITRRFHTGKRLFTPSSGGN